jgi:hypothetical protein
MRFLKIPLLVLALVGLLAASGCGGDDESTSSSSSEALTADEYATQAREVLTSFGQAFTGLGTQISQSSSPEEFSGFVDDAEAEIQSAIDDFSAIQPPEEAQEGHDQILAALEDFSSGLTDVSDAADAGDKAALQEAATALQQAGLDFQTQIQEADQSLKDAGINLDDSAAGSTGG